MSRPELADVQGDVAEHEIPVARAGIADLALPAVVVDVDGSPQPTIVTADAWAAVPAGTRGAHMSRLAAAVGKWRHDQLRLAELPAWLGELAGTMEADQVGCRLRFDYFLQRIAPVTKADNWLDCQAQVGGTHAAGESSMTASVAVPVTMLCPCSKQISERGAHSQRGVLRLKLQGLAALPCLGALAQRIEGHASARLYAVLKREDEKAVTEQAYDNPRFAEDAARLLAADLLADDIGGDWRIEVENLETIHNHQVFATISSQDARR